MTSEDTKDLPNSLLAALLANLHLSKSLIDTPSGQIRQLRPEGAGCRLHCIHTPAAPGDWIFLSDHPMFPGRRLCLHCYTDHLVTIAPGKEPTNLLATLHHCHSKGVTLA